MFEAQIQKNIEAAGGRREGEQVIPIRVQESRGEEPSLSAPSSRMPIYPDLDYAVQNKWKASKNEPTITFKKELAYGQPEEVVQTAIPSASQTAQAAAKALARESRRCDRLLTL